MIQLRNSPMEKMHGQDMRAGEGECLQSVHALPGHITLPGPSCVYKSGSLPNITVQKLLKSSTSCLFFPPWRSVGGLKTYLLITCLFGDQPHPEANQEAHPVSPHLHKLRWDSGSLWITKDTPGMQQSPRILGALGQKLRTMTKYIFLWYLSWSPQFLF